MKLSCNIIRDILPLVEEDLASEDTVDLVNEHLKHCIECRAEYEEFNTSKIDFKEKRELEAIPLKNVKRKLKNRNIYIGIYTAFIVALVLFIVFDKTTKPIPLSHEEAIESIEEQNGKILIKFNENVSNYDIIHYEEEGQNYYNLMTWGNGLSKLLKKGEAKSSIIKAEKLGGVYYIGQDRELDEIIYGNSLDYNSVTLPRLSMNYYFLMSIVIFVIFMILSFIFKDKKKKIITSIMYLALSYIISNFLVLGISRVTYHILRDLFFVSVTTVLLFIIIMLLINRETLLDKKLEHKKVQL